MRRGVVIAFALVALLVAAPNAFAYRGGPTSPITDPANKTAVKALISDLGAGTTVSEQTGMARAAMAAGRLATLAELGTIPAGSYMVYKIADSLGVGGYVYKKITGHALPGTLAAGVVKWDHCPTVCFSVPGFNHSTDAPDSWAFHHTTEGSVFPATTAEAYTDSTTQAIVTAFAAASGTLHTTTVTYCQLDGVGVCYVKTRSNAQIQADTDVEASTAAAFAAAPTANKATAGTNDTSALSDADLTAALNALGANDSTNRSTSDPDAEHATDWINHQLDPTYSADNFTMPNCLGLSVSACNALLDTAGQTGTRTGTVLSLGGAVVTQPAGAIITTSPGASTSVTTSTPVTYTRNPDVMPVLLPQPLLNETADEFIARLHALGYTGAISVVELTETTGVLELGASAPVRIRATTTTGVRTLDPLAWPATAPRIDPTSDLEISENPSTYPPATLEELPPPGTSTGPTCDCPAIDFTPITDVSLGDKFPFAIFGYVASALDMFDVTPTAPEFDLMVHAFTFVDMAPQQYKGDLGFLDGYMGIVRGLMAFALWIGALWFVGARLLGFKAAGDLSDAADDGGVY